MDALIKQLLLDMAKEEHGENIDTIPWHDGYVETNERYEFWYNVGTSTNLQYQRKVSQ